MNEIFVYSQPIIYFTPYDELGEVGTASSVSVVVNGITYVPSLASGVYKAILPTSITSSSGQFIATWTYTLNSVLRTEKQVYYVVTPYAYWNQWIDTFTENDQTYQDFLATESFVRQVINWYCGQSFDTYTGSYLIDGGGSSALTLPKPLISVVNVTYQDYDGRSYVEPAAGQDSKWEISEDRFVLRFRSNYQEFNPNKYQRAFFKRNTKYAVNGVWGYETVPYPVLQAAKLLISDWMCQDKSYRQKYLDNIRSGNWRIEFNEQAFIGTGNVDADHLLADYREFLVPAVI